MDCNPDTRLSLIAKLCDKSDDQAWSEFVQTYEPVIHRFLQRHGFQYADAIEVTQEVLGGVLQSIDSWDGTRKDSTFRGWLHRIAQNKAVNHVRKLGREDFTEESILEAAHAGRSANTCPERDQFDIEYERQLFRWAAERVRPTVKKENWIAFWRTAVEDLPIAQVASDLGVEASVVHVARCRIMNRISNLIHQRLQDSAYFNKETQ
ncbi:MAG: sigma-70 family RNA polymerase sigma factor [Planctomycetota bacterium]